MPVPLTINQLFSNNAVSLLAAPITSTATSLTVISGQGALFPTPTGDGSDYFLITLEDQLATIREIIKVTARSGDTLTFLLSDRGLEGTSARAWTSALGAETVVDHRITAETMQRSQELPGTGKLYAEHAVSPGTPVATGTNAVAMGSQATAQADNSLAIGVQSLSRYPGVTLANGRFGAQGDAQSGKYLIRSGTASATPTELFIDGTGGSQRLVLPSDSTWIWEATIIGHRTDATDGHAGYRLKGVIYRVGALNTTTMLGSPSKEILAESNSSWDVSATADTVNGSLKITVTGESGKVIRWLAVIETTEVTN
jgi:hypothetical protein